jgi:hypothetical protein
MIVNVECAALLRYFGIRASVVEFVKPPTGKRPANGTTTSSSSSSSSANENKTEVLYSNSGRPRRRATNSSLASCYVSSDCMWEEVDGDGWEMYAEEDLDDNTATYYLDESNYADAMAPPKDENEDFEDSDEDFEVDEKAVLKKKQRQATLNKDGSLSKKPPKKRKRIAYDARRDGSNSKSTKFGAADLSIDPLGERLSDWIVKYFNRKCYLPPLYFQHDGHSRTIVGYEKTIQGKMNLLIFDPLTNGKNLRKSLEEYADGNMYSNAWKKQVKRGLHTLKREAYEILAIEPGIMTAAERQNRKFLEAFPEDRDLKLFD